MDPAAGIKRYARPPGNLSRSHSRSTDSGILNGREARGSPGLVSVGIEAKTAAAAMNTPTQVTLLERLREGSDPLAWDEFYQRATGG